MTPVRPSITRSPAETVDAGRRFSERLRGGEMLALIGSLGSGKTQFVKGIASGLLVPEDEAIISPTFVLVREYAGRLRLYHLDLYRLRGGLAELETLGWSELRSDPEAIVVVEWADRVPEVLADADYRLVFSHAGGDARSITIT